MIILLFCGLIMSIPFSFVDSILNVFKTTTLVEDIASFMIDPRPWFIVFGKHISYDDFELKSKSYLNLLISTFQFTECYIDSEDNSMITCSCYDNKPENLLENHQEDFDIQFNLIKTFLVQKSAFHPKFVSMEANYIQLFNYFRYTILNEKEKQLTSLNRVTVKYFDFPIHYIATYPYNLDGDNFFDLELHRKVYF